MATETERDYISEQRALYNNVKTSMGLGVAERICEYAHSLSNSRLYPRHRRQKFAKVSLHFPPQFNAVILPVKYKEK